jgi:N-[(2S)-2-amino-2-carboxyethyl]-L-glutamate dehydrogenase
MGIRQTPEFVVIDAHAAKTILDADRGAIVDLVKEGYHLHEAGMTVTPDSQFLRFPDRPMARIIAKAASVSGDAAVDGMKWIASNPDNVHRGIPRATGLVVLNSQETGRPFACIEGSAISAYRTAASAALAARWMSHRDRPLATVGFVGTGTIASAVLRFMLDELRTSSLVAFDADPPRAAAFADAARRLGVARAGLAATVAAALSADLVVIATTAVLPHLNDASMFAHEPLVLHLSLRDLAPSLLTDAWNIVDDVEHALQQRTSLQLASELDAGHAVVAGTLCDVIDGRLPVPSDRLRVFSPFGLAVLDLLVAHHVYRVALTRSAYHAIEDFYGGAGV